MTQSDLSEVQTVLEEVMRQGAEGKRRLPTMKIDSFVG